MSRSDALMVSREALEGLKVWVLGSLEAGLYGSASIGVQEIQGHKSPA